QLRGEPVHDGHGARLRHSLPVALEVRPRTALRWYGGPGDPALQHVGGGTVRRRRQRGRPCPRRGDGPRAARVGAGRALGVSRRARWLPASDLAGGRAVALLARGGGRQVRHAAVARSRSNGEVGASLLPAARRDSVTEPESVNPANCQRVGRGARKAQQANGDMATGAEQPMAPSAAQHGVNMATQSSIEWTEITWNPVYGCSIVAPGCRNCYAMLMARRLKGVALSKAARGEDAGGFAPYADVIGEDGRRNGEMRLLENALSEPAHWKRPRTIFVN